MRSSEDSADDEFVFVMNREVRVQTCEAGPPCRATGRRHRHQPRLNQPIPTTLDLEPPRGLHGARPALTPNATITTTARAKVTPLPPELIELLPPHLRENTIADYPATSPAANGGKLPWRLAPLLANSHDHYCNLDAPDTAASPLTFEHLSELVSSSDAFSSTSDDASSCQNHTRASSLPLQRPGLPPSSTGVSHTAPAALTLTDSGISSAGSSSISSRSSSSKSLPRESLRAPGAPLRNAVLCSVAGSAFSPPRVSNCVVSTGSEDRVQGRGRLVTRTPSPMRSTCRVSTSPQEGVYGTTYYTKPTHRDAYLPLSEAEDWERPQLDTVTSSSVGSAFVPTARHRLKQTPTTGHRAHLTRDESPNRVEVSAGSGVVFYNVQRKASLSPTRAPPPCCTPPPQTACRLVRPSPPPSPEMRRAWNVVGVPVSCGSHAGRSSPVGGISPCTSSGRPSYYRLAVPQHDPNAIYDNIMLRQSPSHPVPATPPCRLAHSPGLCKPPSPPQQRRASRSPSPAQGWVSVSRSGSPHCPPCHHDPNVQHGGCWVPACGSSPQLCPEGGTHGCPGYMYRSPPCAAVCAARSHSCDRLPAHPSPPPSPVCGQRSASPVCGQRSVSPVCGRRSPSPWRGESAPPISHRHSPSPDRTSGRPPRPRRPTHRKAKTVEVGYLGSASQPPAPAGVTRSPSPATATPMYMSASAITAATPAHAATTQAAGNYCHKAHQLAAHYRDVAPHYQNLRINGDHLSVSGHGDGARLVAATPPPLRCPSEPGKQELTNGLKQKVTYKTAIYKCMKSLLKPTH